MRTEDHSVESQYLSGDESMFSKCVDLTVKAERVKVQHTKLWSRGGQLLFKIGKGHVYILRGFGA